MAPSPIPVKGGLSLIMGEQKFRHSDTKAVASQPSSAASASPALHVLRCGSARAPARGGRAVLDVPAACPIRRQIESRHGYSRTTPQTPQLELDARVPSRGGDLIRKRSSARPSATRRRRAPGVQQKSTATRTETRTETSRLRRTSMDGQQGLECEFSNVGLMCLQDGMQKVRALRSYRCHT